VTITERQHSMSSKPHFEPVLVSSQGKRVDSPGSIALSPTVLTVGYSLPQYAHSNPSQMSEEPNSLDALHRSRTSTFNCKL
jgi:hypothetical protein